MSTPSTQMTAASLPSISELRKQLGYGDVKSTQGSAFIDEVRVFRKRYRTADGMPGVELYDWRSEEQQKALTEMTNAFLDLEGNGNRYWPSDPTSVNFNHLKFSEDSAAIRQMMKQLIFRINQQQYRNHKYKNKDRSDNFRVVGPETIELDSDDSRTSPALAPPSPVIASSSTEPLQRSNGTERATEMRPPYVPLSSQQTAVMFQYLDSISNTRADQSSRTEASVPKISSTVNNVKRKLGAENLQSKRLKLPAGDNYITGRNQAPSRLKRVSPRERKVINRPERATTEQIYEAMTSPTFAHSSENDRKEFERVLETIEVDKPCDKVVEEDRSDKNRRGGSSSQINSTSATIHFLSRANNRSKATRNIPSATKSSIPQKTPADPAPPRLSPAEPEGQQQASSLSTEEPLTSNPPISNPRTSGPPASNPPPTTSSTNEKLGQPVKATPAPISPHITPPFPIGAGERASADKTTPATSTTPGVSSSNPPIEFIYRIILSRRPFFHSKGWKPEGRFQDRSLADLFNELPFEQPVDTLAFILIGPNMKLEDRIDRDDEARFEAMKRLFNRQMKVCREAFRRSAQKGSIIIELEIEGLRAGQDLDTEEIDDAEIDW